MRGLLGNLEAKSLGYSDEIHGVTARFSLYLFYYLLCMFIYVCM